jgi:hypothetical protein
MSTDIGINRPAKTRPGTAPVAMQHGRHGDRLALARLRVKRRWLLCRYHDASFTSSSRPPAAVGRLIRSGPSVGETDQVPRRSAVSRRLVCGTFGSHVTQAAREARLVH